MITDTRERLDTFVPIGDVAIRVWLRLRRHRRRAARDAEIARSRKAERTLRSLALIVAFKLHLNRERFVSMMEGRLP